MEPLRLAFLGIGVAIVVLGLRRAREPWSRYQALRAEDANIARYESWRGGTRGTLDTGTTGASIAMEILRRQARFGVLIAAVGVAAILVALLLG